MAQDSAKEETQVWINSLKDDLETQLSEYAKVATLHGYCFGLLHRKEKLRNGLSSEFTCQPGLASLIRSDWKHINDSEPPHFIRQMRELEESEHLSFYLTRSNYYDAVDFDDCVFRVYKGLTAGRDQVDGYELVLIDEYQDFNALEDGFIELLSQKALLSSPAMMIKLCIASCGKPAAITFARCIVAGTSKYLSCLFACAARKSLSTPLMTLLPEGRS